MAATTQSRVQGRSGLTSIYFAPLSVGLHLLLALLVWVFVQGPVSVTPLEDGVAADILHVEYPELTVRRAPPPEPTPESQPALAPEPIRPKFSSSSFALASSDPVLSHRLERWDPDVERFDVQRSNVQRFRTPSTTPDLSPSTPIDVAPSRPSPAAEDPLLPADEAQVASLRVGTELEGDSPDLRNGTLARSRVRRGSGGGFSWTAYGNALPQQGRSDGTFRGLMIQLAQDLEARTDREKLDVVFVVDATGSMKDNIRGIRAYLGHFAERLRRDGKDVAFGAVIFTDLVVEKPKAKGITDEYHEIRNWLYHTDYLGGGDLAESGLEAVVAAIRQIDYRRGSSRQIVLVTDGPFHDADFDGQSQYALHQVIELCRKKETPVTVIGIDYLSLKQLASATGGLWYPIPGKGYLEDVSAAVPEKRFSGMGVLSQTDTATFEIAVPPTDAEWVELTWHVLSPLGELALESKPQRRAMGESGTIFVIQPPIPNSLSLPKPAATDPYTLICHLSDNRGRKGILRSPIWLH